MLKIGLTGGFGTGKTTVARLFKGLGARVIDADAINHQLLAKRGDCAKKIVRAFGHGVLRLGQIDRKKLAAVVFNNRSKLVKLCRIVHPAIIKEITRSLQKCKKEKFKFPIIIDAPLLIEAGLHKTVDILIVVKASRQKQISRIVRRMKIDKSEVLKRIKLQIPLKEKIRLADFVIDNNASLTKTKQEVYGLWQKLTARK